MNRKLSTCPTAAGTATSGLPRLTVPASRQVTFERDPPGSVGVPVWSPTGNQIVFILTRQGITCLLVVDQQ